MSTDRSPTSATAAFFDLDRTLVSFNSGLSYARYEREHGRTTYRIVAKVVGALVLYHLSLIDMERTFANMLGHFHGMPLDELDQRTREWFARDMAPRLLPGAARRLRWHRERGHPCVLLSNSSCLAAACAAEAWQLDDWIANHFELDDEQRLAGSFVSPICYGAGKIHHAEQWAAEHGADLDRSYFYSDSYSDVPMLERVGFPRVVHPDPRLFWYARRRGWRIEDWRKG